MYVSAEERELGQQILHWNDPPERDFRPHYQLQRSNFRQNSHTGSETPSHKILVRKYLLRGWIQEFGFATHLFESYDSDHLKIAMKIFQRRVAVPQTNSIRLEEVVGQTLFKEGRSSFFVHDI